MIIHSPKNLNVMKTNFYFCLAMLAALTMTMASCSKDDDNGPTPQNSVEIIAACAHSWNAASPGSKYYTHEMYLFEKGINPSNEYITGSGEMGTGRVIRLNLCNLTEEVHKLDRDDDWQTYDRIVPGTYTWDVSEDSGHLNITYAQLRAYENNKRTDLYNDYDVTACTVEVKRGHLGQEYEITGTMTFTDGNEVAFAWKGIVTPTMVGGQ